MNRFTAGHVGRDHWPESPACPSRTMRFMRFRADWALSVRRYRKAFLCPWRTIHPPCSRRCKRRQAVVRELPKKAEASSGWICSDKNDRPAASVPGQPEFNHHLVIGTGTTLALEKVKELSCSVFGVGVTLLRLIITDAPGIVEDQDSPMAPNRDRDYWCRPNGVTVTTSFTTQALPLVQLRRRRRQLINRGEGR